MGKTQTSKGGGRSFFLMAISLENLLEARSLGTHRQTFILLLLYIQNIDPNLSIYLGISETSGSLHQHTIISTTNTTASAAATTTTANTSTAAAEQPHNNTAAYLSLSGIPASTLDESDCAQLIQSLSLTSSALPTLHENRQKIHLLREVLIQQDNSI